LNIIYNIIIIIHKVKQKLNQQLLNLNQMLIITKRNKINTQNKFLQLKQNQIKWILMKTLKSINKIDINNIYVIKKILTSQY
jgi:hypothetical protein